MWYNNILEIINKTVKAIWKCKLNYLLIPLPTVCCDLITSCQLQDDATFGNDATFGMSSVFTLKFNVRFKMITIQSVLGNLKWGECLLKVCQRYYMKWEECLLVSLNIFLIILCPKTGASPVPSWHKGLETLRAPTCELLPIFSNLIINFVKVD